MRWARVLQGREDTGGKDCRDGGQSAPVTAGAGCVCVSLCAIQRTCLPPPHLLHLADTGKAVTTYGGSLIEGMNARKEIYFTPRADTVANVLALVEHHGAILINAPSQVGKLYSCAHVPTKLFMCTVHALTARAMGMHAVREDQHVTTHRGRCIINAWQV